MASPTSTAIVSRLTLKCGPVMRRTVSSDESGSASTSVSTPLRRNRMLGIAGGTCSLTLLRLVAELLDDIGPLHNIAAQIFVELIRCHGHRNRALFGPESDNVRPLHRVIHRGIQIFDNRLRRAGRRHQSEPDGRLVAGDAGLGDRR